MSVNAVTDGCGCARDLQLSSSIARPYKHMLSRTVAELTHARTNSTTVEFPSRSKHKKKERDIKIRTCPPNLHLRLVIGNTQPDAGQHSTIKQILPLMPNTPIQSTGSIDLAIGAKRML